MFHFGKLFHDKRFLKAVTLLALPIAFQNLLNALLNIIDSLMVSQLGENPMGAVLLSNQFVFLFQLIIFVIGGTASIFISQFYGKGDPESMPRYTGFSLLLGLAIGTVFTLFSILFPDLVMKMFGAKPEISPLGSDFLRIVAISFLPFTISSVFYTALRGIKRVRLSVFGSLVGIGLNVFFNFSLMFGKCGMPELGLNGAAWGTVISRGVELFIVLLVVLVRPSEITASLKKMTRWDKPFVKGYFGIFAPTVANEVFWALGSTAYFAVFARLPDSENVLAALNITQSVDKLIFVFLIGIGNATAVLIGNLLGAGKPEQAREDGYKALTFALLAGVLLGVLNYCVTFLIPLVFTKLTPASIDYANRVLLVYSVFLFVRAVNFTAVIGILRAGGDSRFCMILETCTIWLLAVPSVAVGGLVFGLSVAWLYVLVFAEELFKGILILLRVRSGKWQKNLTRDPLALPDPIPDREPPETEK